MAVPKEFRDDEASSGSVLANAMPICQPGRFLRYSRIDAGSGSEDPTVKSKKMGISRNPNRIGETPKFSFITRFQRFFVPACVAFTLICGY